MIRPAIALLAIAAVCLSMLPAAEKVRTDNGMLVVDLPDVPEKFRNPWPADMEAAFQKRARAAVDIVSKQQIAGGTYGENEKNFYPRAMFAFLGGRRADALKALQETDNQAKDHHAHTLGMDYYWCFTLKGQLRKYFYFGDYLDPEYKKRMREAAKVWTEEDPLFRPHPVFGKGSKPASENWGPDAKGSWVDIRGTDNLRAMREVAVYLFAEEAGNEKTRVLYKQRLRDYVAGLYHAGMTEWDSENYHGHSIATWHNLYDFAKDDEVRGLAKAALDWLYTAGALKYHRGAFGGPNCRDYGGGNAPFSAGASHSLALAFGDTATDDPAPDRDEVHQITSAYRPPQAVVALARKQFVRPAELRNVKPPYVAWEAGKEQPPRYFETFRIGRTYQMGSVVSADPERTWNVAPFKLTAVNSERGIDFFVANTSPLGEHQAKNAGDQIGQAGPLLVWLAPAKPARPFYFQLPKNAKTELTDGLWLIGLEKTFLAIKPIRLTKPTDVSVNRKDKIYDDDRFLKCESGGDDLAGFALEVGEAPEFADFEAFAAAVRKKNSVTLEDRTVTFTGASGGRLSVTHNPKDDLPVVTGRDWSKERDIYAPIAAGGPVSLKGGVLRVIAGEKVFESEVPLKGPARWSEK